MGGRENEVPAQGGQHRQLFLKVKVFNKKGMLRMWVTGRSESYMICLDGLMHLDPSY